MHAPDYGFVAVNFIASAIFSHFFTGNISDEALRNLTKSGKCIL